MKQDMFIHGPREMLKTSDEVFHERSAGVEPGPVLVTAVRVGQEISTQCWQG